MFRPRVIPVLLLKGQGLVKSIQFKKHNYIGDPINAVKLFNDLRADELVFLDIQATAENRLISLDFVCEVGEEANMPFAVGGGIKSLDDIEKIIKAGAEKVIINSAAAKRPDFIKESSANFGTSTIAVCIDVKKSLFGKSQTWINGGTKATSISPLDFARQMEQHGAGELIVQSIERDGTLQGYDIELIQKISENVSIPVVALGGAGCINHLVQGFKEGRANALAAGSLFVYQGNNKGVLINYPDRDKLSPLFS